MADVPEALIDFQRRRSGEFYPKADIAIADEHLRELVVSSPRVTRSTAIEALASVGIAAESVESLGTPGTFHELFSFVNPSDRGRHVIKLNRVPEWGPDAALVMESTLVVTLPENVRRLDIGMADITRGSVPTDFQLMRFSPAPSLRSFDDDEHRAISAIAPWAEQLRYLHEVEAEGFGLAAVEPGGAVISGAAPSWAAYLNTRRDEHLDRIAAAGLVTGAEKAAAAVALDKLVDQAPDSTGRILHGDCGPHNAVDDPAGVALIDWEDALVGDPLFEVAMWATFAPERRWEAFFTAYFGSSWMPTELFWMYFLRISLAKTVVRLRFGYEDKPGRPPASQRIQRALAGLDAAE